MALFKDQAASFKIRALQHAGCVFDCGLDGTSITQGVVCRITILERCSSFRWQEPCGTIPKNTLQAGILSIGP